MQKKKRNPIIFHCQLLQKSYLMYIKVTTWHLDNSSFGGHMQLTMLNHGHAGLIKAYYNHNSKRLYTQLEKFICYIKESNIPI